MLLSSYRVYTYSCKSQLYFDHVSLQLSYSSAPIVTILSQIFKAICKLLNKLRIRRFDITELRGPSEPRKPLVSSKLPKL